MPRVCLVCSHPDKNLIDRALVRGEVLRTLAALYRLSEDSLARHKADHLPVTLVKAHEEEDVRRAIDHIAQLKVINRTTIAILREAREQRDPDTALKAIDRIQRQIELQAKLIGELDERPQVNVLVSSDWLRLRTALLEVLQAYPEVRLAVAQQLAALEGATA